MIRLTRLMRKGKDVEPSIKLPPIKRSEVKELNWPSTINRVSDYHKKSLFWKLRVKIYGKEAMEKYAEDENAARLRCYEVKSDPVYHLTNEKYASNEAYRQEYHKKRWSQAYYSGLKCWVVTIFHSKKE